MKSLSSQFSTLTPVLLLAWLLTLMSLLMAIPASQLQGIPLDSFTRDPNSIAEVPFYLGFFSNIGIVLWSAAVAVCFFAAWRLRRTEEREKLYFLVSSSGITLLMTFDDLFQIHELVLPVHLGIPELVVYVIYMVLFLAFLLRFGSTLLNTDFLALGLAFFFLGASTLIDLFPLPLPKDTFLEDAIKLLGTVTWLVYFGRTADHMLDGK